MAALINAAPQQTRNTIVEWAKGAYPQEMAKLDKAGRSPFGHRVEIESLLPEDGSYKCRWNLLGAQEYNQEYVDWSKIKFEDEDED